MSQNFNFDGGGPFGPPYGSMPNSFEPSGGGNMIFTTQSSPIQQSFPQSWSSTPGWPSFENQDHGFGLPFQGQNLGGSGYFPNQQQDYVPFDEGEDFYNTEGDMGMGNGHETHNFRRNGSVSGTYPSTGTGQLRSNSRSVSTMPAIVSGTKAQQQQKRRPRLVVGNTNDEPTTDARERAAQLRAKLLAQQPRKSATPTPVKSKNLADTLKTSVAGQTIKTNENMPFQSMVLPRVEDKSAIALQNPASIPSTSQADIESLFSEIKAGMSGEATPIQSSMPDIDRTRASLGGPRGKPAPIKARAHSGNDRHRPDPNGNTPSSEVSELGEIREDAPESEPTGQAPEPLSPKDNRKDQIGTTAIADPKLSTKDNSSQPARDAAVNSASIQSEIPVITTASVKPSETNRSGAASSTPPQIRFATSAPHGWKKDSKSGPSQSSQDHRLRSGGDLNQSQPQAPRAHPNGPQDPTFDRERRYSDKDQRLTGAANNNKGAVKSHKPSDPRGREGNDADLETVVGQQGPSERNLITPRTPIANSPDNVKASANKNTDIAGVPDKDYAAPEPPSQESKSTIEPSMFADQQMYEDVIDWLEMTDWNDVAYRTQSLTRHRKMKALDLQRAELEREAQLEMEQRSRSVRARSTLPVEPGNIHSVFSSQILRTPSGTAMAPPPVRLKEPEDLGIKIKDLANPVLQATSGSGESNRNTQLSPKVQGRSSLVMKRVRGDDESKRPERADKLPRLDLNERSQDRPSLTSPMIKDESLESRITRSGENHSATYKRRSRSPEYRAQPLSPNVRRASDMNGYHDRSRGAETTRVDRWSPRASRNTSPNRRDSGTRGLALYQDPPRFDRDLESRTQHDREFEYQSNYRGRGNGRARLQSSRGGYKPHGSRGGGYGRANGSESLNLKQGDARYFMIKSWNAENVEIAQRDSTWATQKKNLDTLTEAYNTCRHVILFFSVNNSRAFQGYARMASAPGTAPTPSWAKQLIWESTPPFFIEWIATSETRFNRCGYLKNSLNEGQAVLVGRDGQEIEESCGRGLCELIDSMANYGGGDNEWRSHGSPGI